MIFCHLDVFSKLTVSKTIFQQLDNEVPNSLDVFVAKVQARLSLSWSRMLNTKNSILAFFFSKLLVT